MKRIHYISGILITIFIVAHLINHLVSIFGPEAHISMMDDLRVIYRNTFMESLLLISIAIQIYSGIKLFITSRKHTASFFDKIHIWSGLYMAFFFIVHVSAVLAGRYLLNFDTNIYFGAALLNAFPFILFFFPYYSLAIISFFGHIAAIHSKKMKKNILGISPHAQSLAILIMGMLVAIVTMYGLTNGFMGLDIPSEYQLTSE